MSRLVVMSYDTVDLDGAWIQDGLLRCCCAVVKDEGFRLCLSTKNDRTR